MQIDGERDGNIGELIGEGGRFGLLAQPVFLPSATFSLPKIRGRTDSAGPPRDPLGHWDSQSIKRTGRMTERQINVKTYRETDRETDRRTNRQTDKQTDRETEDRKTDRQNDGEIDRL